MHPKIKLLFILLGLIVLCESCSNLSPAGFWTSFQKDLIIKQESDQGPWGGTRIIHWKTKSIKPFSEKELLDFATKMIGNWLKVIHLKQVQQVIQPYQV